MRHDEPALAESGGGALAVQNDVARNAARQASFKKTELEPRLAEARAGKQEVFFVDAAHFVLSNFLRWIWLYVKAASGRQRHNVLRSSNAITHELISVANDNYVTATIICELLRKIAARGLKIPVTLVMDNAIRCAEDAERSIHHASSAQTACAESPAGPWPAD